MKVLHAGMAAVLTLATISAQAAPIVQTFDVTAHYPDQSLTHAFQYFDTHGGTRTLVSVSLETHLETWDGAVRVDNDGGSRVACLMSKGAQAVITFSDSNINDYSNIPASYLTLKVSSTLGVDLAANGYDSDSTTTFDLGGEDYASLAGPNYANRLIITEGPRDLTAVNFIGLGTFDATYNTTQTYSVSEVGLIRSETDPSQAAGHVILTYNYITVPEPTSLSILGLGTAGLLLRRRKSQ